MTSRPKSVGAAQRGGPKSGRAAQRGDPKSGRAHRPAPTPLYVALAILYLLHNDLWLWHDGDFVLGLPVGMTYHIGYCLAVATLLALLVRWAWPASLTEDSGTAP